MALVSPGVEVSVIDESFYTPAGAGTVPMIFIATAENKPNASGTGIAQGTLKANAGRPYLVTSQRELGELFGDALFYSDANGNMIHGGELNEYGLQTAYSVLGVSNRAYVARADLNLGELEASAIAPGGEPVDGSYWLDTGVTGWGLLEWNGSPVTTTGGQTFNSIDPIVITDPAEIGNSGPRGSVGIIGDYAIDATTNMNELYYKTPGNSAASVDAGTWVQVGSDAWKLSWPTVTGNPDGNPQIPNGATITINTVDVTTVATDIASFVGVINGAGIEGVYAIADGNAINLYADSSAASTDNTTADGLVVISGDSELLNEVGLIAGTYAVPEIAVQPHTSVPLFKLTDAQPKPTGSIWLKTTSPNGGANFSVKQYNSETQLWQSVFSPLYTTAEAAIFNLDRSGGGLNLQIGDIFIKPNVDENSNLTTVVADGGPIANYKPYVRAASGTTRIQSDKITTGKLSAGSKSFTVAETVAGSASFGSAVTVTFTAVGTSADAEALASAINSAGLTNVEAEVDSNSRVTIVHRLGGEIKLVDTSGALGNIFTPYNPDVNTLADATTSLYLAPGTDGSTSPAQMIASNWQPLTYTASDTEPTTLTADGALWYSSVVDEVDILVHDGQDWVGYATDQSPYSGTDPNGPIVAASEPQDGDRSDGGNLVDGDIWISTADLENFPIIYKYNINLAQWVQVDKTDQTTENGILFADARWSTNGGTPTNIVQADIADLLLSNYKDPDAPDPALYPKGMLLWNTRRSGFNVKRFERNYIATGQANGRFKVTTIGQDTFYDIEAGDDQSMSNYYPHRWVTDSGNNEDGSGTFGRFAQRKSVVQALQAMVNSNQEIRDEETRFFNLMATPGYPELIGEMITLNYDRRLTAFVVGDTPARLTPDATSLNEWGANVRNAVEDNDNGAPSRDEYMAMYYPWGFTSDNAGNNVVVPPSHMALRTLILNDQVAYPWFAPAGTRRGGVTNATATGYIDSEGEFVSIALNTGQRDTLYSNNINPITFISGAGLVVFGQKTRARNASALDRVNVARLMVYMRVQFERLARPYLFEPNDSITRTQIKSAADNFLLELVGLRAIYDYITVCDASNNTPARIDRNELWLDVAIEPVKAIEFIYIPLRIKNTGEISGL